MPNEQVVYESVPKDDNAAPELRAPKGFGVRHTQAVLLFLSLFIAYTMRAQLSVSVVAMTSDNLPEFQQRICLNETYNYTTINNDNITTENYTLLNKTCQEKNLSNWNVYRTYKWNKATQEMILFSFFVGYTCMMIPMGMFAQRFGGKKAILISMGSNAVLSAVTPWLPIFFGWMAMCVCRFLQGMTQAAIYPSTHTMLGKWAPGCERGRLGTYAYTGIHIGTIIGFQLAGLFAGSPYFGWPATFWFLGGLSAVCFVLVFWLGASSPYEHPKITKEELVYITNDYAGVTPKRRKTPWKKIITSSAAWSPVISHMGSNVAHLTLMTQIPLYMNKILHVDIKKNGIYSSLPYIAMYFTTLLFGNLADIIANRKVMSIANMRRTFNTIGLPMSGLFLIGFCFVNNTAVAIVLLVLCMASHSGIYVGFHINQLDLAPNFAGPMMAFSNMLANLSVLLVPIMTSSVLKEDVTNQSKWQILFIIIVCIQALVNLYFFIFVKGTVQDWNFSEEDKGDETEKLKEDGVVVIKSSALLETKEVHELS